MQSIPRLKNSDISHWTDEVNFQRGLKYYQQGAIFDQRCQGMMLKSKCSGSQAPFYRQEILFDNVGIKSAECSCPVGEGGHCKHSIALLLTWVNDPDTFQEIAELDVILEKLSKPELIALIQQMIEQEPDLEFLLELPLPGGESKPLNLKAIQRQVDRAFQNADFNWGSTDDIKRELNPVLNLAEGYLSGNDAENSALIYRTVVESLIENGNVTLGDEGGELLGVMSDCSEALGECLGRMTGKQKRIEILQVLFNAYQWDVIMAGGVGAAECVPEILTEKTTAQERIKIAKWTREIIPQGTEWSDGYHREVLGKLLLDLEADTLDDEAYLNICRQTGRLGDLIDRLLKLNRIDEVLIAAQEAEDYPLFKVIDVFTNHNRTDLIEKIMTERVKTKEGVKLDSRLMEWLSERLKQRGDFAGALELEQRLFWNSPNIEQYKNLCEVAKALGQRAQTHDLIIAGLEKQKRFDILIDIYLDENEVGNALATLKKFSQPWGMHSTELKVAQAARTQFPLESIGIFNQEAERFIAYRNRDSYSQGALCLREVRDIYHQLNDMDSWNKKITEIRVSYKKLPALQDELNKLKL